jgi:hypothetical protein
MKSRARDRLRRAWKAAIDILLEDEITLRERLERLRSYDPHLGLEASALKTIEELLDVKRQLERDFRAEQANKSPRGIQVLTEHLQAHFGHEFKEHTTDIVQLTMRLLDELYQIKTKQSSASEAE